MTTATTAAAATTTTTTAVAFLRSMMKLIEVRPTAMKYVMERMTPGAMNSVKVGVLDPYTGSSNWIGRLVVLLSE